MEVQVGRDIPRLRIVLVRDWTWALRGAGSLVMVAWGNFEYCFLSYWIMGTYIAWCFGSFFPVLEAFGHISWKKGTIFFGLS